MHIYIYVHTTFRFHVSAGCVWFRRASGHATRRSRALAPGPLGAPTVSASSSHSLQLQPPCFTVTSIKSPINPVPLGYPMKPTEFTGCFLGHCAATDLAWKRRGAAREAN